MQPSKWATAAFDYADEALAERIKSAVGEKGVDAILDMSAGAHIEQDMQILAANGRISFLSPGKSANLPVPLRLMMTKRIKLTGAMHARGTFEWNFQIDQGGICVAAFGSPTREDRVRNRFRRPDGGGSGQFAESALDTLSAVAIRLN
jgi:NADPH:quinone reductase-like Zn-dependent oxidoreductase